MKSYFLALALGVVSLSAQSAPITWTLKDVTFDDGGTASGSFVYDATSNSFSDISIIAYDFASSTIHLDLGRGPGQISFNWLQSDFDFGGTGNSTHLEMSRSVFDTTGSGGCYIQLAAGCYRALIIDFSAPLTEVGGSVFLKIDDVVNEKVDSARFPGLLAERYITGGLVEATPVPVPQAFWLFGSALGVVGWQLRKSA